MGPDCGPGLSSVPANSLRTQPATLSEHDSMVSLGSASISGSDRSSQYGEYEPEHEADEYYSPSIADHEADRSDDWNGPLALDSVSTSSAE